MMIRDFASLGAIARPFLLLSESDRATGGLLPSNRHGVSSMRPLQEARGGSARSERKLIAEPSRFPIFLDERRHRENRGRDSRFVENEAARKREKGVMAGARVVRLN